MPAVATLEAVLTLQKQAYEKGLKEAQQQATQAAQGIQKSADPAGQAWKKVGDSITTDMKIAAGGILVAAGAATALGVSSVMVAARVEEMDVVLAQLGKTAGISQTAIDGSVRAIKEQGITTQVAQGLTAQFIRNQLDLADATKLARVAQDAAVLTQKDSSETLSELNHYIQTGNSQLDVARALNLSTADANAKYAASLGKSVDDLTEQEKMQARVNSIQEAGIPIQGAYEAAMESGGKQMRSFSRYIEEIQEGIGAALLPTFNEIIKAVGDLLKGFGDLVQEGGALRPVIETIGQLVGEMVRPVLDIANGFVGWMKNLDPGTMKTIADVLGVIARVIGPIAVGVIAAVTAWKIYSTTMAVVKTAQLLLNAVMATNPIFLIIGAVAALAAGFIWAYKNIEPFRNAVNWLGQQIANLAKIIWDFAQNAWQWVKDMVDKVVGFFQWLWEMLVGGSIVPDIVNGIIGLFTGLWQKVTDIGNWIKDAVIGAWNWIKDNLNVIIPILIGIITGPLGALVIWILMNQEQAKAIISGAWNWIKNTVQAVVGGMWDWVTGRFQGAISWIQTALQNMATAVSNVFTGMRDAVNEAMKTMANWVIDRLNDALGVIKKFLDAVNDSPLGKLGVNFDTSGMKPLEHFALGGIVRGVGTRDTVPAMLTPGEVVLNRAAVALLGGVERANRLNARGLGAGADTGTLSGLVGRIGGQCLAWVASFLPQFRGIAAAKDLYPLINTRDPQPGRVFVQTFAPYGHTGFVTGTGNPVPVIDSNWNLDERIQAHAIPANQIAGYSDVGQAIVGKIGDLINSGADLVGSLVGDAMGAAGNLPWPADVIAKGIIEASKGGLGKLGEQIKNLAGNAWNAASTAVTNAFGKATAQQLHGWMDEAGFRPAGGTAWADKIVSRESGWRLDAVGPAWNNDGGSRGLWQIQPGAHPWARPLERLFEGLFNTQAAAKIYASQGPNAWSTNYDHGGLWRSGTGGFNSSGQTEAVLTGGQLQRLLEVLDKRSAGDGLTVNNIYRGEGVTADEVIQDLMIALRMP